MTPNHQCSTKMLIRRFESMSSSDTNLSQFQASSASSPVGSAPSGVSIHAPVPVILYPDSFASREKGKDKSPIRQSIRNLLSVFMGKGRVPSGSPKRPSPEPSPALESILEGEKHSRGTLAIVGTKKSLPDPPVQYVNPGHQVTIGCNTNDGCSGADLARPLLSGGITGKHPRVTLVDAPVPPIPLDLALLESPPRKLRVTEKICGALLYLSHHQSGLGSSSTSVWLPCEATLRAEERIIFLSWANPENAQCLGLTETHTVTLTRCTDVRSLITNQLDEQDMRTPLSGCRNDLRIEEFKVFEVLFEGKEREKFAARTVRERARWVSAIWDSVLPSQEPESAPIIERPEPLSGPVSPSEACASGPTHPLSLPVRCDIQRPLPVTPTKAAVLTYAAEPRQGTPLDSSGCSSPTTSSVYPPTRPLSRLSALTPAKIDSPGRCHSPSVVNLNRMSVVKQRLAQIKDMELQRKDSTSSVASRASLQFCKHQSSVNGETMQAAAVPLTAGQVGHEKGDTYFSPDEPRRLVSSIEKAEAGVPAKENEAQEEALETSCEDPVSLSCEKAQLNLDPLLDFLSDHTQEQREQVMHLENQLVCLQDEIQRLPQEFSCIVGPLRPEKTAPNIQQLVTKVERKVEVTTDVLGAIEDKLTTLSDGLQQQAQIGMARDNNAVETLRSIDELRTQFRSHFPAIIAGLARIQEAQERNETKNEKLPLADRNKQLPPVTDLSAILAKLDAVIALQRKTATSVGRAAGKAVSAKTADVVNKDIKAELLKISSILEQNNQQRALHTQQQADSVRYLTELNTWLETFVNHGTSQIESVAANVEQLCRALSRADQLGRPMDAAGCQNFLGGHQGLVSNNQAREQGFVELQKSINALLAAMRMPDGSFADLGSVANAIERSRQEQANLFRVMTQEVSSEVKGERIRFVEAMKEATAINIQTQVDSLKQSLVAEVVKMSNELGCLHQEKRAIESQIQGLVTFQDQQRLSGQTVFRHHQSQTDGYPVLNNNGQLAFPGR